MKFVRALISAPNYDEAKSIARFLVEKQLIAGALLTAGEALYWWEGKFVDKKYWNISAFARASQTSQIIDAIRPLHSDQVPIISFYEIAQANADFFEWLAANTRES